MCCWVERLALEDGIVLSAIAYDPMNDPSMDLADAVEFRRWQLACERGDVAGLLASPPCSTFSRARHRPLPGGGGPRPLRSRENVWFPLPDLKPNEIRSVVLGSLLAISCLDLIARVGGRRCWAMLEHPADPGRAPFPSVFCSDLLKRVQHHIRGSVVLLHQCRFDAMSVKPTMLLTTDPDLDRPGLMCNHHGRHTVLAGRTADGAFRTTAAAAYPPALCRFMAESAVKRISQCMTALPPSPAHDNSAPASPWVDSGACELLSTFGASWRECCEVQGRGGRLQI